MGKQLESKLRNDSWSNKLGGREKLTKSKHIPKIYHNQYLFAQNIVIVIHNELPRVQIWF